MANRQRGREGTYVSPSRMFAIQGGTEADMAATKNTLEKCMRMERPRVWWDPASASSFRPWRRGTRKSSRTLGRSSPKVLQTPLPPRWNRATSAARELARPRQARHLTRNEAVASSQAFQVRPPLRQRGANRHQRAQRK